MSGDRVSASKRGYDSKWRRAREGFLRSHPLCRMCQAKGRVTAARVVDHVVPHRGDTKLFWDKSNWQPLCKPCHDSHKQRIEKSGTDTGCDIDGVPIDKVHHWNTCVGGLKV